MTILPDDIGRFLARVFGILADDLRARSATCYVTPKLVVTATRRFKPSKSDTRLELVLTVGEPNYRGKQFVKSCVKAGEPFPVKRTQIRWIPIKGTKRAYYRV